MAQHSSKTWQRVRHSCRSVADTLKRRLKPAAPLALGLFASLSLVGNAGLPTFNPAPTPSAVSTGDVQMQPSAAAQIALLQSIKAAKTPIQQKIDSRLFMGMMKQKGDARMAALPDFRFVKPERDGRVPVDIVIGKNTDVLAVWDKLNAIDATIITDKGVVFSSRTVRARVRMDDVDALAAMGEVRKIRMAIPAVTNAATPPRQLGPVAAQSSNPASTPVANALTRSQGARTHGADTARSIYGTNGAGQTICVLSDGATSYQASQASGDLPPGNQVFILPGQIGTGDEGTAMMEIIYDVAPAARIGFATAFTSEASFAQNILDLAAAGCTIIVDDIIYLDESPFQDGPVAQSVNTVTANGVLYFSSAGNEGNLSDGTSGTWEGNFLASTATPPTVLAGSGPLHNFGNGGQSILVAAGSANTPVILIWAEHSTLTEGFASTDYDVYDLNGALTTVFDMSADAQDGVGGDDFPIEFIGGGAFTGERLVVARFAAGNTTSAPAFNMILFRGRLEAALATSGATRGHSAAANAFSTAATPAATAFSTPPGAGPFPNLFSSANLSETFSSDGPRRIILSPTGEELTPGNRTFSGGVLRQKPDLTAADGVSTSAPGFATFFGTSAAAPHAAAIAGLVRSALPTLTQSQVRNLLTSTAIDIEVAGVDRTTGAGIVMPVPALQAGGAVGQPSLSAGTATYSQIYGDSDGVVETNEIFAVTLPLTNVGAAPATGLSVSLGNVPSNVTVLTGPASYPDLAPGQTAPNATPIVFRVEPAFVCGTPIAFSAVASYGAPTSPQSFPLSVGTGSPGPSQTFSYTTPVVAIPDSPGAAINVPLNVSGLTSPISDLNFRFDGATCNATINSTTVGLNHTWVGDLTIGLVSPSGTVVSLMNRPGGTGNSGNNFCQTLLDDESTGISIQNIAIANAPWVGSFRPAAPLSGFDGQSGNGTWQLRVQDLAGGDLGSVRAFSLQITGSAVCNVPPQPAGGPTVVSVARAGNSPTNASTVAYNVTFSEPVIGVDATDFSLATTGNLSTSVASVSGSGATYTVNVATGTTGSGTVTLSVADNDSILSTSGYQPLGGTGAGNGNFTGETYLIDHDPPTATVAVAAGQANPATVAPVNFDVQFSEATGDFTAEDVVLGGTAGATTAVVSGSGSSYTIAVSGMTANGTVIASVRAAAIRDAAGNDSLASNLATINFQGFQPDVGFTLAAQSVTEGNGGGNTPVTVTATLAFASVQTVTVPVTVGGGTATQGTDYTLATSTLTFPAGATVASVTLNVLRDNVVEPTETVVLNLGTPVNARLGTPASTTISIQNDDDDVPNEFTFGSVSGVLRNSVQTSAPVVITGINTASPITVTGGSYSINGSVFTTAPGAIINGDSVRVRVTASDRFATSTTGSVTIGGVTGTYTVTTRRLLEPLN